MPIIANYSDAVRQILKIVSDAWTPTGFPILYQNTNTQIPAGNTPWARVTLTHVTAEQRTISQPTQLYTQRGTVIVQIFVPEGTGVGSTTTGNLVELMLNAFRGTATLGGAFFMKARAEEVGHSGGFYQVNVSAIFQYDQYA